MSQCKNCQSLLVENSKFCHECGQDMNVVKQPLKEMLLDFLGSMFNFDNKIWLTLKNLSLNPGIVIKDYNESRKVRYVPPLRLYIFLSFFYFLLLSGGIKDSTSVIKKAMNTERDTTSTFKISMFKVTVVPPNVKNELFSMADISVEKVDSVLRSRNIESHSFNNRLMVRIIEFKNGKVSEEEIVNNLLSGFSKLGFALMPIFALLLWLIVGVRRVYFAECFVFSIYFHSFTVLLMMVNFMVQQYSMLTWFSYVLTVFGLVVLYRSIKQVFERSGLRSKVMTFLLVVSYTLVFASFFLVAFLWSLI